MRDGEEGATIAPPQPLRTPNDFLTHVCTHHTGKQTSWREIDGGALLANFKGRHEARGKQQQPEKLYKFVTQKRLHWGEGAPWAVAEL